MTTSPALSNHILNFGRSMKEWESNVRPGDRVRVETWATLDGLPRELTVSLMGPHYWIPKENEKHKLSYEVIKEVLPRETPEDIEGGGGTFESDPKWSHDCAKAIMKHLGVKYDPFKMYEVVRIMKEYIKF